MPKRVVGELQFEGVDNRLANWRAAGLTLAVISLAAFKGLGALVGVALLAPVLFAITRLRHRAPSAGSLGELVGGVLGVRAAAFTAVLQGVGYTLLAVVAARSVGLSALFVVPDESASAETIWPAGGGRSVQCWRSSSPGSFPMS